jgi:dolichol kinase
MLSEIKRKLFHLLGLIYVAGITFLPRKAFVLIMTGLLAAEIGFELARLKIPAFNEWLHKEYGDIFREEEKNQFSGVVWMSAGVIAVGVLLEPILPAITALLFLILGDSAASLVGKTVGGIRWPNSKKTLAGSAACFLMCFAVGMVLLWPQYPWPGIFITALTVALFEVGYIPINDNLIIPLVASLAMLIVFRLKFSLAALF